MNTCAVTIAGPDRRVDLVVSTETPIAELIPTFVELSMDEAPHENGRAPVWTVAPPGQQPLQVHHASRAAAAKGALPARRGRVEAAAAEVPDRIVAEELSTGAAEHRPVRLPADLCGLCTVLVLIRCLKKEVRLRGPPLVIGPQGAIESGHDEYS